MLGLLAKIIPLGFASALSPGILALTVYLLGNKHSKLRILALFIGTIIVAAAIIVLGFLTGANATPEDNPTLTSAIIDLLLGGVFIYLALKSLLKKERGLKKSDENQGPQFFKWLILGILINATNFDAVFLSFTSAKEIGAEADVNLLGKIIAVVINVLFFSSPITLPVAVYLIFPKTASKLLDRLNIFLLRYSRYIVFAMFAIFGVIFLYRGIHYFF